MIISSNKGRRGNNKVLENNNVKSIVTSFRCIAFILASIGIYCTVRVTEIKQLMNGVAASESMDITEKLITVGRYSSSSLDYGYLSAVLFITAVFVAIMSILLNESANN